MKYIISFLFCINLSVASFACSCAGEGSFCNHIQSDFFVDGGGIVCIAESTGNVVGDYDFRAFEMKLVELLYGEIQSGSGSYLNSDSTFWILLGQSATCYEGMWLGNAGDQFVMAPTYGDVFTFMGPAETGYSLFLCTHDVFNYENVMIGPIINDYSFFDPNPVWEIDTIPISQFPRLIDNCSNCLLNLNLSGTHNLPSVFNASSTILSTAEVNTNVVYKANDRITLLNGFKTDATDSFSVLMDGCD